MHELGFNFLYPMLLAITVYAGSTEFLLGNMLLGSFHPLQAFLMVLMVNAREYDVVNSSRHPLLYAPHQNSTLLIPTNHTLVPLKYIFPRQKQPILYIFPTHFHALSYTFPTFG